MKIKHYLLIGAGAGLLYFLYKKNNNEVFKDTFNKIEAPKNEINENDLPKYSENDLKKVRRCLYNFIEQVYDSQELLKDPSLIHGKVIEITNIKSNSQFKVTTKKSK